MRAGTLRTRVTIQRPTMAADAVGERIETWATVAKRYGSLVQRTGREAEGASELSITRWELRIRYDSVVAAVKPSWRLLAGSQIFDIDSIINQNHRNRELKMILIEVV